MNTRDGYLNLALALLKFIADAGRIKVEDDYMFDDRIKDFMYQVPTLNAAWLVGTQLYKDHEEFMAGLSQLVKPQLKYHLLNDPSFRNPSSSVVE